MSPCNSKYNSVVFILRAIPPLSQSTLHFHHQLQKEISYSLAVTPICPQPPLPPTLIGDVDNGELTIYCIVTFFV